jgi:ATP-dependent DNA helicase RecQ
MLTRALSLPQSKNTRSGEIPCDPGLFDQLRLLRKELADRGNLPAYVIFSDVTLRHFCRDYPTEDDALLTIPGVGEKKREDYGQAFIAAICAWLAENPRLDFAPLATLAALPARPQGILLGTAALSLELFRNGQSIPEIAQTRGLVASTIESHLTQAIENGELLDPCGLYTVEEQALMQAALAGYDELPLKPVFEQLDGRISYGKLRLYRAFIAKSKPANHSS